MSDNRSSPYSFSEKLRREAPLDPKRPERGSIEILKLVRAVAAFFGVFLTSTIPTMAAQHYFESIPLGTIREVHRTKGGQNVVMTDGHAALISYNIIFAKPGIATLRPGDVIEKPIYTFRYRLNGFDLTNGDWFMQNESQWLAACILLGIFWAAHIAVLLLRRGILAQYASLTKSVFIDPVIFWLSATLAVCLFFKTAEIVLYALSSPFR